MREVISHHLENLKKASQCLLSFAHCVEAVEDLQDRQATNSDKLYEEKLNIMENLRKSFEIFCKTTGGGNNSGVKSDTIRQPKKQANLSNFPPPRGHGKRGSYIR
jgi:hypothetical protein